MMKSRIIISALSLILLISSFTYGETQEEMSIIDLIDAYKQSTDYFRITDDYELKLSNLQDVKKNYDDITKKLNQQGTILSLYEEQEEIHLKNLDGQKDKNFTSIEYNAMMKAYGEAAYNQLKETQLQMYILGETNAFDYKWALDHKNIVLLNEEKSFVKKVYQSKIDEQKAIIARKELQILENEVEILQEQFKIGLITYDAIVEKNKAIKAKKFDVSMANLSAESSKETVLLLIDKQDSLVSFSVELPTRLPDFVSKTLYDERARSKNQNYQQLKYKADILKTFGDIKGEVDVTSQAELQNHLNYLMMNTQTNQALMKLDAGIDLQYNLYEQSYKQAESASSQWMLTTTQYNTDQIKYDSGLINSNALLQSEVNYLSQQVRLAESILSMY